MGSAALKAVDGAGVGRPRTAGHAVGVSENFGFATAASLWPLGRGRSAAGQRVGGTVSGVMGDVQRAFVERDPRVTDGVLEARDVT